MYLTRRKVARLPARFAPSRRNYVAATTSPPSDGTITSGLNFPGNITTAPRFLFSGAAMPNIVPLTMLWKKMPATPGQAGYRTTFFHARQDGNFVPNNDYWGCHEYPDPPPDGTNHKWEISINGGDNTTDVNSHNTAVVKGAWISQAAIAQNISADHRVQFYWDIRNGTDRLIQSDITSANLANAANSPGLVFGGNAWAPTTENLDGLFRGLMIFQGILTVADVTALDPKEDDAAVAAVISSRGLSSSLWYYNMNPTPDDISDKSGNGHHPAWVDSGNKATLWTP